MIPAEIIFVVTRVTLKNAANISSLSYVSAVESKNEQSKHHISTQLFPQAHVTTERFDVAKA